MAMNDLKEYLKSAFEYKNNAEYKKSIVIRGLHRKN